MFCIKFVFLVLWEKLIKANSGTSILKSVSVVVTQTWVTVLVACVTAWQPGPPVLLQTTTRARRWGQRTRSSPLLEPPYCNSVLDTKVNCVHLPFLGWGELLSGSLDWTEIKLLAQTQPVSLRGLRVPRRSEQRPRAGCCAPARSPPAVCCQAGHTVSCFLALKRSHVSEFI